MLATERAQTIQCPSCQALVPTHSNYVTWCDKCGWNLKPADRAIPEKESVFARKYADFGRQQTEALYQLLATESSPGSRRSTATIGALIFASAIHLMTLATAALGLALIIVPWPHFLAIAIGVLLVSYAWSLRPRIARLPDGILPRDTFPAIYTLADVVADDLGTPRVAGILMHDEFNASLGHAGWRNRPILFLGLPLWSILDERERLALIGHELAHEANGDLRRGLVIGSALDALIAWYASLTPPTEPLPDELAFGAVLAVPLMKGLRLLPRAGIFVLSHLLWRDSQRAEYLADRLAAKAAGTVAMIGLLDKLQLRNTFDLTLQRVAYGLDDEELFDGLRRRIRNVPAREMERLRRVQRLTDARLDSTHPPTAYRIDLLMNGAKERPAGFEALALVHEASLELTTLEAPFARELIAEYTSQGVSVRHQTAA